MNKEKERSRRGKIINKESNLNRECDTKTCSFYAHFCQGQLVPEHRLEQKTRLTGFTRARSSINACVMNDMTRSSELAER